MYIPHTIHLMLMVLAHDTFMNWMPLLIFTLLVVVDLPGSPLLTSSTSRYPHPINRRPFLSILILQGSFLHIHISQLLCHVSSKPNSHTESEGMDVGIILMPPSTIGWFRASGRAGLSLHALTTNSR